MSDSSEYQCNVCGFRLYIPIAYAELRVSQLGLYPDRRFLGRSILVLRKHYDHLEALPGLELASFWADAVQVGSAIKSAFGASRVNYSVLCNATPHTHIHIIPRYPEAEDLPTRSPWSDPRPLQELSPQELQDVAAKTLAALQRK